MTILYTSGSTGTPKVLPSKNVIEYCLGCDEFLRKVERLYLSFVLYATPFGPIGLYSFGTCH